MLLEIQTEIRKAANPKKADILCRFFKTGKGEYAEGDKFLGLTVPETRSIVKKYSNILTLAEAGMLLQSTIHEERLAALLILKDKYQKSDVKLKQSIYKLYLENTRFINNWDLVDLSAEHIIGAWLDNKNKAPLFKLVKSKLLWERRISILATFHYIKKGESALALELIEKVLGDKHDLMHKAAGWMLREIGKRCSETILIDFLKKNYSRLPRTTLRYAIERFPKQKRLKLLTGNFK